MLLFHLIDSGLVHAALGGVAFEINVALHYIEFMVDLGPTARRLDDHEAIHPMREMIGDHWRRAVVNINARIHRLKLKNACGAGRGLSDLATAARASHAMRVDA